MTFVHKPYMAPKIPGSMTFFAVEWNYRNEPLNTSWDLPTPSMIRAVPPADTRRLVSKSIRRATGNSGFMHPADAYRFGALLAKHNASRALQFRVLKVTTSLSTSTIGAIEPCP